MFSPHKWELAYRQHWTPDAISPALNRGIIWHKVMEIHYRAIQSDSTTMARRQAIVNYLRETSRKDPEEVDLIAWMFDGYEDRWGTDDDWEIVAVEDQRIARLPYPSGRLSPYWVRMRVDLIIRERTVEVAGKRVSASKVPGSARKLWLVDHKSGKDLPKEKELDIDDQFGLYTWGCRQLGDPVFGSLHNAARTYRHVSGDRPLDERFLRSRLYRTDRELDTIAQEAMVTARTAYRYGPGEAPRAPDPDRCRWRCPYTEPCLVGRKSGDAMEQSFLSSGFTKLTEGEALIQRGYETPMKPGD